jgi:hypothetical protein
MIKKERVGVTGFGQTRFLHGLVFKCMFISFKNCLRKEETVTHNLSSKNASITLTNIPKKICGLFLLFPHPTEFNNRG